MELAKSCDYAIRGLLLVARQPDPFQPMLLHDIAGRVRAPEAFMSKIFQNLRASRVVRSHRGRERGYSLARPAGEISLYDIIVAMRGPAALRTLALGPGGAGGVEGRLHQAWRDIEEQVVTALKGQTLFGLLQNAAPASD